MNSFKIITIFFLTLITYSCGFKSVYNLENKISNTDNYEEELAAIKIKKESKRINQVLRNNLEDALNPDDIKVETKYSLEITLVKSLSSTFITSTGASGRNKVILNANYKLIDLASGKTIATGISTANDDFDVETRRFANYITQEAIELNLTKIIAKNIRNLLVGDITSFIKNGRKVIDDENDVIKK
jgi:LPS-assembly lipoprotein